MTTTTKENSAWRELCQMTGELFAKFGARPAAFAAACAQRPDLAAKAIDPTGAPVAKVASQGTGQAPLATPAAADPIERAVERLMATAASPARVSECWKKRREATPTDAPEAPTTDAPDDDPLGRAVERRRRDAGQ